MKRLLITGRVILKGKLIVFSGAPQESEGKGRAVQK
jgi:hypothetical protein